MIRATFLLISFINVVVDVGLARSQDHIVFLPPYLWTCCVLCLVKIKTIKNKEPGDGEGVHFPVKTGSELPRAAEEGGGQEGQLPPPATELGRQTYHFAPPPEILKGPQGKTV